MHWEDVPVQLVDLPPITAEFFEPWETSLIRSADAALLVADLASDDVADATEAVLARLAEVHTELVGTLPYDVEDEAVQHVKTVLVANKADAEGAADRLEVIREWFSPRFPILPISVERGEGLDALRRATYDLLGVLRVYTKVPGKPVDRSKPFTVPDRQHGARSGPGNPSRLRAHAEIRPDLGDGRLRRPDGEARPRASRRRRRRIARLGDRRSIGRSGRSTNRGLGQGEARPWERP